MNDLEILEDYLKNFDWEYWAIDDGEGYKYWNNIFYNQIKPLIKSLGLEGIELYNQYKGEGWGPISEKKEKVDSKVIEKSNSIMKDLKGNKREFVKRYGKDAEKVMKGRAIQMAKKNVEEGKKEILNNTIKEVLSEITDKTSNGYNREDIKQILSKLLTKTGCKVSNWSEGELMVEFPKPDEGVEFRLRIYL
jgi:hypothetical protein